MITIGPGGLAIEKLSSIEKAIKVLSLFSIYRMRIGIEEMAQELGFPKPTIYRLVRILIKNGFMEKDPRQAHYCLGSRLLQMGHIVMHQKPLTDVALPIMQKLTDLTLESASLDVIEGQGVLSLRVIEGPHPIRMNFREGSKMPFHGGAPSKLLMAYLSSEEQDRIIQRGLERFTDGTITVPVKLKKELAKIRDNGYAYSDQELQLGVRSIAAPIRDYTGNVIGCIGLSGPVNRFEQSKIERFVPLLIESAEEISRNMGFGTWQD